MVVPNEMSFDRKETAELVDRGRVDLAKNFLDIFRTISDNVRRLGEQSKDVHVQEFLKSFRDIEDNISAAMPDNEEFEQAGEMLGLTSEVNGEPTESTLVGETLVETSEVKDETAESDRVDDFDELMTDASNDDISQNLQSALQQLPVEFVKWQPKFHQLSDHGVWRQILHTNVGRM